MRVPAHLVTGEDASLLSHATTKLVDDLVGSDRDLLLVEVGPEESIVSALRSVSLFTDFQVVLVRAKSLEPERLAEVIAYLDDLEPSSVLVLSLAKAPPSLVKAVKKVGSVHVTSGKNHHETGRSLLEDAPVRLDARARMILLERVGEDLGRVPMLLDLLARTFGAGASLGASDVEPFLGAMGGVPLWELTDAIDEANPGKALSVLSRLLAGKAPMLIWSVVSSHVERMFRLSQMGLTSEQEAAAFLGLKGSTFPAKKAIQTARRYGQALPALVLLTTKAGNDIRGHSGLPPEMVLEVLVARLAAHPR